MELFGLRLKGLRSEKGFTQQQLADKLGIVKATVSSYEKTANYPSVEILINICKTFGVSADFLLGLSDDIDMKISHLTDEQILLIMNLINQFERLNRV
jgi:transcriptional regulator with XRE-family HTH domain